MFPIYFIVGLINIFAQRNNYDIKDHPYGNDIRLRRSLPDPGIEPVIHTNNFENQLLDRAKRYAYYRKIKIPVNTQNNDNGNQYNHNDNSYVNNNNITNRYDIFNPNYNYLFNRTSLNGSYYGPGYLNNRPVIRSYPYGYPPGYEPRPATPGYRDPANTPTFYNYQNPNGQSFAGYKSYTPRTVNYSPLTNMLASYPKNTEQNVNIPSPYGIPVNYNNSPTPSNNNNIFNLPTAVTPTPNNNNSPTSINNNIFTMPTAVTATPVSYNNNNSATTLATPTPSPSVNNTSPSQNMSTTTPKILSSCVICNIPCPNFMQRLGGFCVPDYD